MSNLTEQECRAGISRRALDSIKANGNGAAPAPGKTQEFRVMTTTKLTPLLQTPARNLDILETLDGYYILRDTSFSGFGTKGVTVQNICLEPHEFDALIDIAKKLRQS